MGDLFRQSLTLTCWPRPAGACHPVTPTRPVSLEMETEMLRVVITAPPSFCQRPCCWSRCRSRRLLTASSGSRGILSIFPSLSYHSVGRKKTKKHCEINLPQWCPVVELRMIESPECSSGISRCSLSQGGEQKKPSGVQWFSGSKNSKPTFLPYQEFLFHSTQFIENKM